MNQVVLIRTRSIKPEFWDDEVAIPSVNQVVLIYLKSNKISNKDFGRNPFSESGRSHKELRQSEQNIRTHRRNPFSESGRSHHVQDCPNGMPSRKVAIPSVNQVVLICISPRHIEHASDFCRNPFSESGRSHLIHFQS